MAYARELHLGGDFFMLGLQKWFARFGREDFQGVSNLFECPLIPEARRTFFQQGFSSIRGQGFPQSDSRLDPAGRAQSPPAVGAFESAANEDGRGRQLPAEEYE